MKRHSHVQSGLAISDGRWVIDVSYNSGLDPCSRKSPSPASSTLLPLKGSNRPPSSPVLHHHHGNHGNHRDAYM